MVERCGNTALQNVAQFRTGRFPTAPQRRGMRSLVILVQLAILRPPFAPPENCAMFQTIAFLNMSTSTAYRQLPPLAGIASLEQAMQPGLSVEECVRRLKRYHYAFKRLHQIFTARITAEPNYELKMAFSLHAHICAEHVTAFRKRVGEMREPPLGLEVVPDPHLEIYFDEILAAPSTEELVFGLYGEAVPALKQALERHLSDTNLLVD